MKRKKFSNWCMAMALGITMVLESGGMYVQAAPATEAEADTSGADIVEMAGNSEMKAYGQELENGGSAKVNASVIPQTEGTSYYVDSENGDDSSEGTSEKTAWKSIEKINETTFHAGDKILLKAGSEWQNVTLSPKGSGEKGNPIVISAYGEGELPKLTGNAEVSELLYLENQEYWDISNLEITNLADGFTGKEGEKLKDVRGIRIAANPGKEQTVLSGYHLHDLYIHDVSGEVKWISGSGTVSPGILKGGGWDGSKRTGGILFEVLQPDEGDQPITFDSITVEKNVLNNNSFGGIMIKQWKGDKAGSNEFWANREKGNHWTPHTNVVVQDNYLSQKSSNYACNTIYLTSIDGAVVQRNVSREAGTCGIEMYYTDNTVVQYNEVYDTRVKAGGADSNAIDPDKCATNALIQYNYVHDTGDGILLCGFVEGSSVVRYNVIQDAEKRYINPHGDKGENYIYNNIFYNSKGNADFVASSGGSRYYNDNNNFYYLYNNIFYNAASDSKTIVLDEGSSVQYDNNCYYGDNVIAPSNEENEILKDPQFVDADISDARTDTEVLANLKLKDTSPLYGMAREVDLGNVKVEVGNTDFFGAELKTPASVGIAEYEGEDAIVKGYVTDEFNNKVEGATVTLNGSETTTTDENGYYQFTGVKSGAYSLVVSKEQYYEDGTATVSAEVGNVSIQNLKMGACKITTGTLKGQVVSAGKALPSASVTVTGESTSQTVLTDENGEYSFELPAGTDYKVEVSMDGYEKATANNVTVTVLGTTTIDLNLTKVLEAPEYLLNEDFSSYETGTFTGNDTWGITDPGEVNGAVTVEEENGKQYLHLSKTGSAGVIGIFNKQALNLTGTVTIEARVKRTNDGASGSANQYGLYSFNSADWNASNPSGSKNPMATFALSKGNILTHNKRGSSSTTTVKPYQKDQWYTIRNVVDVNNGTFDIYVDDMETPVLENQPLRTVRSALDYITLFSSTNNYGDICVDYIRVCKGVSYDYNDTKLNNITSAETEFTKENDTTFSAKVSAETEKISVTPALNSAFSSVMINGVEWDKENPVEVALQEGENTIPVVVTAESGAQKEYSLQVTRESLATIAYLKSLNLEGITLSPEFNKDTENYTAESQNKVVKLSFEKAADICTAKVSVNGKEVEDLQNIELADGKNTIQVYVESQDGADNITYTIEVTYKDQTPAVKTDKSSLTAIIEAVENLKEEDFSASSWAVLKEKLETAKIVLANDNATQEEVDTAYAELVDAYVSLENGINKVVALQMKAEAEAVLKDADKYQSQGIAKVQEALDALNAGLENAKITQTELDNLSLSLLDALMNIRDVVDGSRLQAVVDIAEKLLDNKEKFTSTTADELEKAVESAKKVLENKDRTEKEIEDAYQAVNKAIAGLKYRGNREILKPFIEKAEAILAEKEKYASGTLEGLAEANETAKTVYENEDALQDEINEAAKTLATELAQVRLLGDVNHDDKVDTADAAILLKVNAELSELPEEDFTVADVNRDGVIDTKDAVLIEQYAAEMISKF